MRTILIIFVSCVSFLCAQSGVGQGNPSSSVGDNAAPTTDTYESPITPIVHDGAAWVPAQADEEAHVATLVELSNGERIKEGVVNSPGHGYTVGDILYLDQTTAGGLTTTKPFVGFVQQIGVVVSADVIAFDVEEAYEIQTVVTGGFFQITAEESSDLSTGPSQEWAFGNGDDTPIGSGVVIPFDCELFSLSLNVEGGSATVRVVINSDTSLSNYEVTASSPSGFIEFSTPLKITAGDILNFRTISSTGGNTNSGRVTAWLDKNN